MITLTESELEIISQQVCAGMQAGCVHCDAVRNIITANMVVDSVRMQRILDFLKPRGVWKDVAR